MSDQMDSTQPAEDKQGLPNPDTSPGTEDQPHSDGTTSSLVSSVLELIRSDPDVRKEIGSVLRSDKDRGVHRAETQSKEALQTATEVKDELARVAKYLPNVDPKDLEDAQRMAEDEEMRAWYQEQRASGEGTVGTVPNLSKVVEDIGNEFGADWDDPGIKEFLGNNPGDDVAGKFAVYLSERQQNKPSASPAGISAPTGGTPPKGEFADMDNDAIGAEIIRLGRVDPRGSKEMREKYAAELDRRDKK
jgi:hypothetical protein